MRGGTYEKFDKKITKKAGERMKYKLKNTTILRKGDENTKRRLQKFNLIVKINERSLALGHLFAIFF